MKRSGRGLQSRRWAIVATLLFFCLEALTPAASESLEAAPKEKTGGAGPIHVTSDTVESDHGMRWIEFKGNVKATQEDVVITADRIKIFYEVDSSPSGESPRVAKIMSQGNVKIVFDNRNKTAMAEQAVYDADNKMLVLSGGEPTVRSGENMIRGEKITLFQGENRTVVEGDQKSQVEAILHTEVEDGLIK